MKTDVQGCSTCPVAGEQWEEFRTRTARDWVTRTQYDYRTPEGKLFSCVGRDVEDCRRQRDAWLERQGR